MDGRRAQKAFETGPADVCVGFMVHFALVVVEKGELLVGQRIWLQCDVELVLGLNIGLELRSFALMDG